MGEIKIKKISNLGKILKLKAVLEKSFPYLKEKIRKNYLVSKIEGKEGEIIEAIFKGKTIGFSAWLKESSKIAYIWWLVVLPEFQGNNFGKILLRETLEELKEKGFEKVWAKIKNDNFTTISLIMKFHFYIKGVSNEDGIFTVIVEKNLKEGFKEKFSLAKSTFNF